jgi:hypothetical protein
MSTDLGKKLRDQVKLTQELDSHLLSTMNEKLRESAERRNETPDHIKDLLEKLNNEGVLLLSLSEMLQLKCHLNNEAQNTNNQKLVESASENEKALLQQEIFKLKDLMAKMTHGFHASSNEAEWRAMIIQSISELFQTQSQNLLAELRNFVASYASMDTNKRLVNLEEKIIDQKRLQEKSIEYLVSVDREALISEIKSFKEELKKLINEMSMFQENERQLKRELKLMEYAKDAEAIKGNDLKQSLNLEKTKCLELMEKLNQEKKRVNSMQEKLNDMNDELFKIKEHLNSEIKNYNLICKELELEKSNNEHLRFLIENYKTNEENRLSDSYVQKDFDQLEKHANRLDELLVQEKAKVSFSLLLFYV